VPLHMTIREKSDAGALLPIAAQADLFICECYAYAGKMTGHLSWEILKPKIPDLRAKRLMLTHMNPSVLARLDELEAAGVLIAADGLIMDF
jgi:phosphoribosyl 1,2-cyclic phosphodiesterase